MPCRGSPSTARPHRRHWVRTMDGSSSCQARPGWSCHQRGISRKVRGNGDHRRVRGLPALTCTEPIRLNSAAATEFEPLGVSDHPPANERSEAEGAAVSTAYQVNSSLYAYCSGMGTGLTFSVVRYGFADSRFALGVLGVGQQTTEASWSGSTLPRSPRCWSLRCAPLADSPPPTGTHSLRERVSHSEGAARPSPCCFRSRRRPLRLGSRVVARAQSPIVEPAGAAPRVPSRPNAGFRKVDHCCGPCERREPLTLVVVAAPGNTTEHLKFPTCVCQKEPHGPVGMPRRALGRLSWQCSQVGSVPRPIG